METPQQKAQIDNLLRVAQTIAMALVVSVGILTYMAWKAWKDLGEISATSSPIVYPLVGVATLNLLVVGPFVHRFLMKSVREISAHPNQALGKYLVATVVPFAIFESAAVFGYVVAVQTGVVSYSYALSAGAIFMISAYWPNRDKLKKLLSTN